MRGELIKGHLDLLLLAVVEARPVHGYVIIEELRRRSSEAIDLPEGTVYPALHRLERAGFLKSGWETVAGRRRRVYELTRKGRSALETQRQEWQGFAQAVGAVIGGTACLAPS
ncbi:MAG: PadR family transcriptional regulator [Actinomycetota bacterium]